MLLQRLKGKRSVDALDRVADADVEMVEQARPTMPARHAPSAGNLDTIIAERIAKKLNGRYQVIARMFYLEHRPVWSISQKTGLSQYWLKRHLGAIERLLSSK